MRTIRHTMIAAVFAILVLAAAFAAPAGAVIPSGNLVVNPGAEDGPGATNSVDTVEPPGWITGGTAFTAVGYGVETFPSLADSASFGGGANFFAGGNDSQGFGASVAYQTIDVSAAAPEIDAGNVQAELAARIGGFGGQEDSMVVYAVFLDESGGGSSGVVIGPVTAADRNFTTGLLQRSETAPIFPGARTGYLYMYATRSEGTYNDGYADNVSLTLSEGGPAAPPEEGETVNAAVVSGKVLIRDAGTGEFRELEGDETIPVGSSVDATDGRVRLTSEVDGGTQSTDFYDGQFKFDQSGSGLVTATLEGADIGSCGGAKGTRRASKKIAKLWGNGSGKARTKGRKGSGTVRGTVWLTEERCNGTFFSVKEGVLIVRDFERKENITLKKGDSYLAKDR